MIPELDPFVGKQYKDSLILVLDTAFLHGITSKERLRTLLACAAGEQVPATKFDAVKSKTIYDLTSVLIGKPSILRLKGDDFAIWDSMSYYCASPNLDSIHDEAETILSGISPSPTKVICLTEGLFHCIEPDSDFVDRGVAYEKQIYIHGVHPAEVIYFKSFSFPADGLNRYSLLKNVAACHSIADEEQTKKQTDSTPELIPDTKPAEKIAAELTLPKDIYDIPEDIFSNKVKTLFPCIGILPRKEFRDDLSRFRDFIRWMTQWSGHPTRENVETILRVLTGYPFGAIQEKILWDGRQLRTLLYIVKYMFDSKPGRGQEKKYSIVLDNTTFEPAVDDYFDKEHLLAPESRVEISHRIGGGKGVSPDIRKVLSDLYPTIYRKSSVSKSEYLSETK